MNTRPSLDKVFHPSALKEPVPSDLLPYDEQAMFRLLCTGLLLSLLAASFFALTGQSQKGIEQTLSRGPDGVIRMGFAMQSMPPIRVNPPFQDLALPGDRIEYHESTLYLGVTEIRCFQARLIRDGRELRRWNDSALHPLVIMMLVALIPLGISVVAALFWRVAAGRKTSRPIQ